MTEWGVTVRRDRLTVPAWRTSVEAGSVEEAFAAAMALWAVAPENDEELASVELWRMEARERRREGLRAQSAALADDPGYVEEARAIREEMAGADPEFRALVDRLLEENREILDRLARFDSGDEE